MNRALSDLQKSGESDALYLISAVNGHLHRRPLKKLLRRLRQLGRGEHRWGLIDQIPCDAGGLSRHLRLRQSSLIALRRLAEKRSRFDPRRRRGRLVLVKPVAGKSDSLCRLLEECRRELRTHAPQIGTHRTQIQLLTLTIYLGTALQHLLQTPVFSQTQQENLGQHALRKNRKAENLTRFSFKAPRGTNCGELLLPRALIAIQVALSQRDHHTVPCSGVILFHKLQFHFFFLLMVYSMIEN